MWKIKQKYVVIVALHLLVAFDLIHLIQGGIIAETEDNFMILGSLDAKEWWIEVEITSSDSEQETNDDILLLLYDDFLSDKRQRIKSWHFFREPTLRFRIELADEQDRDEIATELENFLDAIELVANHYFAKHGRPIESFDEGYSGERYDDGFEYKRMWPYQKELWEWGSEMTVEAIKEFRETGANDPPREQQLERIFHLLSNQLSPGYEVKRQREYLYVTYASVFASAFFALVVFAVYSIKIRRIRSST